MVFRKTGCKYTKNISNLQIFLKKNAKFLCFYSNSPENIDAERGCAKQLPAHPRFVNLPLPEGLLIEWV